MEQPAAPTLPAYAELRCMSNFTFLRGASSAEELVRRAHELGYAAIAVAAKEVGLPLILGAQFLIQPRSKKEGDEEGAFTLVVLAQNLEGYGNLCQFITKLRRASEKGTYYLDLDGIVGTELQHCLALLCPERRASDAQLEAMGRWTLSHFAGRCWIGVDLVGRLDDGLWLHRMRELAAHTAIPLVAVGNVHMHVRSRKPLQDMLTATRVGKPLTECGFDLERSAEPLWSQDGLSARCCARMAGGVRTARVADSAQGLGHARGGGFNRAAAAGSGASD